jgi:hypothetical protein
VRRRAQHSFDRLVGLLVALGEDQALSRCQELPPVVICPRSRL